MVIQLRAGMRCGGRRGCWRRREQRPFKSRGLGFDVDWEMRLSGYGTVDAMVWVLGGWFIG